MTDHPRTRFEDTARLHAAAVGPEAAFSHYQTTQ